MNEDYFVQMKEYIMITEHYVQADNEPEILVEAQEISSVNVCLISDLKDVVFKLRAFTESESNDDLGLGIELGMQRAADMIEQIIYHYSEANNG